jgi:hypothetical protein
VDYETSPFYARREPERPASGCGYELAPIDVPSFTQAVALCLGWVFATLLVMLLGGVIIGLLAAGRPGDAGGFAESALMAVAGVTNLVVFGAYIVGAAVMNREPLGRILALRRFRALLLVPMLLMFGGWFALITQLDLLLSWVWPPPESFQEAFTFDRRSAFDVLSFGFAVAIVAPLTEEFFFRSVALRGFLRRYPVWVGVLLTTLLFALIHLNPWQMHAAFALGLIFAWWYLRTGSVWPCVIGHFLHNAASFALGFIPESPEPMPAGGELILLPWWLLLLAAGLVAAGAYLFQRWSRPMKENPGLPERKDPSPPSSLRDYIGDDPTAPPPRAS